MPAEKQSHLVIIWHKKGRPKTGDLFTFGNLLPEALR